MHATIAFIFIFLFMPCAQLLAQNKSVIGTVKDDKGLPLSGVSVMVKETKAGTNTNGTGQFTLAVPQTGTLVFSYVGFSSVEVPIGNSSSYDIKLQPGAGQLGEVIVVAYGRQQKKDLTGSVAALSQSDIKNQAVAGVDQKLAGQVAGVQVANVTGTPGGGSAIKIRGSGSIGAGDDPLFVIDGFAMPSSFNQTTNPLNILNPDDIESITVLKDASSTAIYGSRGSNGVVIITTKTGKTGVPRLDITAYTGIQQVPDKGRPDLMTGQQFAQFRKDMIIDDFASRGETPTNDDIPVEYQNPDQYGTGTNWYDLVLRDAPQSNFNVSLTSAGDKVRSVFSVGYFDQEGVVRYTGYKRYTGRANVEGTFLNNKLKVGLNVAPSYSVQTLNDFERDFVDILAYSQWLSPIVPAKQADGSRTPYITSPGMFGSSNPLNWLQYAPGTTDLLSGIATATASYELMPGLNLKYSFNVNYNSSNYFRFDPSYLVGPFQALPPDIPSSTTTKYTSTDWLSEILLTYDKTFNNHKLNVVAGYSAQKDHWHGTSLFATNYPDDKVQTINAAALITPNYDDIQEWSLLSYLARVNYSYKNKYLLTATIRSDGSSRFGTNNRYGTFPSVGLGWNLSEEDFLKNVSWLNSLKLRGSYGKSGNFDIGNYTQVSNVGSNNYVFGGNIAPGRNTVSLGNPNLTWEKADQVDVGVDATAFSSRLSLTVDYYRRITTSMLYNSQVALSSGYSSAIINSGKILNNGVEISVTSQNINNHSFTWSTNFNISFNHNEVLALNATNDPILSGRSGEGSYTHITQVGQPIGQFFGYVWEGVYVDQADFDKSPKNATSVVGSIKYKDVDGNGIIEPVKDFAVIGTAQPDFVYGMTNNFNYKNFDLSILINGSQGGQVYKKNNQYLHNIDGVFNVTKDVLNRWRSPEEPGNGRVPTTNGGRVLYRDISSLDIEDGSFLSIRNITLGYSIPKETLSKSKVFKGARVYAGVQNAFMFTKYSGANPDVNRNGNSALEPGEDFTNYPLARLYLLGVNFSF